MDRAMQRPLIVGPFHIFASANLTTLQSTIIVYFRPRGFEHDAAYANPIDVRTGRITLPAPGMPATASVSVPLSMLPPYPVSGSIRGGVAWREIAVNGNVQLRRAFAISLEVSAREPLTMYIGAETRYGPPAAYRDSHFVLDLYHSQTVKRQIYDNPVAIVKCLLMLQSFFLLMSNPSARIKGEEL
ncbi:hypothetical protein BKA62DRAFT_672280, partial [Auriculariales sp. MPI-PUGE-AT-0066]